MMILGRLLGGVVGFFIALLVTEVIVGNPAKHSGFDWAFWTDIVLAILGVLVGLSLARRWRAARRTEAS